MEEGKGRIPFITWTASACPASRPSRWPSTPRRSTASRSRWRATSPSSSGWKSARAPIDVVLEEQPPPGTVAVGSSYPLDVIWRGRVLAKGEASPRVEVPGGRQVLTLVSSPVFLKTDLTVQVPPGGQAKVAAPVLGRLNVRAVPDNCEVFVNGAFVDFPPILDRPAAAGRVSVSFRWPDGARSEQTVEIRGGAPTFVVGRKE